MINPSFDISLARIFAERCQESLDQIPTACFPLRKIKECNGQGCPGTVYPTFLNSQTVEELRFEENIVL